MLGKEKKVVIDIILKVLPIIDDIQKRLAKEDVILKKDGSQVTVGDFVSQILINYELQKHFPNDPIMGEEDPSLLLEKPYLKKRVIEEIQKHFPFQEKEVLELLSSGNYPGGREKRFWCIDPIDGTKGYVNREQYVVAIALIEEGEVMLGALGCPKFPDSPSLLIALKNQKTEGITYPNLSPFTPHVSTTPSTIIPFVEQHLNSKKHSSSKALAIVEKLGTPEPIRMDSQCKYAFVATGKAALYLRVPTSPHVEEKIWDHAAGKIIVENAGGIVTDLHGHPLNFHFGENLYNNVGVIASTPLLHKEALTAIKTSL